MYRGSYRLWWRCSKFLSHSRQPRHLPRCQGRQLRAFSPSLHTARVAHPPCREQDNESFNCSWARKKGGAQVTKQLLKLPAANKYSSRVRRKTGSYERNFGNSIQPEGGLPGTSKSTEIMGAVRGDTSNAIGVPLLQVLQSHGHSMLLEGNCSLIRFTWAHC